MNTSNQLISKKLELGKKILLFFLSLVLGFLILAIIPNKTVLTNNKNSWGSALAFVGDRDFKNLFEKVKDGQDINILVLGISGDDHISPNLTDSIMILRINPYRQRNLMISLPRDLYIKTPKGQFSKINSLYQNYKVESILKKVKEITKIDVSIYSIVKLSSLEKIVDKVGGLYLPSPYQNKNQLAYFDGRHVLKYVRLRPDSDFGRMKRQQLVIESLKDKFLDINPIFDFYKIYEIMRIIKSNLLTNLSNDDLRVIFDIYKNKNIKNEYLSIDTSNLLKSKMIDTDLGQEYILEPKLGREDYSEIQELINRRSL
ncbi:MAG: LCP family protein [Candidatus Staskawiczbacteria bacterium]|nr:LCP family protein [Candidatus Staskawiczbacteria bacterium]